MGNNHTDVKFRALSLSNALFASHAVEDAQNSKTLIK